MADAPPGWLRHLFAVLILPFNAAVTIPALLAFTVRDLHWGWGQAGVFYYLPFALAAPAALGGLLLMAVTIRQFARVGRGTLAPWDPTRALVVTEPYARVRNPMLAGVNLILAAESIALGSPALAAWTALFVVLNTLYFVFSEEPGLEKRFGAEYVVYRQNVPRWIPRLRPWRPDA